MKKHIKTLVTALNDGTGKLSGGFGAIRGGRNHDLPGQANASGCSNSEACTADNISDCVNALKCEGANVYRCINEVCNG